MLEQRRKHLLQTIRNVLEKGRSITVFGWIGSNHNEKTRGYAKTGLILFVERSDRPTNVGSDLVLLTRFVSHTDQAGLRCKCKTDALYPHALEIGFLKGILYECEDLFTKKPSKKWQFTEIEVEVQGKIEVPTLNLNDIEKELLQTEVVVDTYDRLAGMLRVAGKSHHQGFVSTHALARILKESFTDFSIKDLVRGGWLVPEIGEGKKRIGWYSPTSKLIDKMELDRKEEPADPIDKAIFLIERRPVIEAEIELLQGKIDVCNLQLKRIDLATELLKKLSEV